MIRAMTVKAATAFSGIGAPECALPGWDWRWSAEIEPFPAAVLAARHPASVNLGDVLAVGFDERAKSLGPIDVLVGGPPCQAFSVAGDRNSLADARGNLSLRWAEIIHAVDPVLAVTENVPGWLSTPDNAFGHFLGALVGADGPLPAPGGQGWPRAGMVAGPLARACWRVLDAQYFGVAQRRERVFVVSSAGDRVDPSQILFEPKSLRRHSPSRGEAGQGIARPLSAGSPRGSGYRNDAGTAENLIAFDASNRKIDEGSVMPGLKARTGGGGHGGAVCYGGNDTRGPIEVSTALNAHNGPHGRLDFESETFVAAAIPILESGKRTGASSTSTKAGEGFGQAGDPMFTLNDTAGTLKVDGGKPGQGYPAAHIGSAIRRLTPVECERLQGFPDGWTAIIYRGKEAADGNRYKALGNSMAVPCIQWILIRIAGQLAPAAAAPAPPEA